MSGPSTRNPQSPAIAAQGPTAPSPVAHARPIAALFRQEAIDAQRQRALGELSLARPVPTWVFTSTALIVAIALIALAVFGQTTRRERVEGFLSLDAGAARLLAPVSATVAEMLVKEGDEVAAGQPLARLTVDRSTASGQSESRVVQQQLTDRIDRLDTETLKRRVLVTQETRRLQQRVLDLQKELEQSDTELRMQAQRIALADQDVERMAALAKSGFASDAAVRVKSNEHLEQSTRLQSMRRSRSALEREIRGIQDELPSVLVRQQALEDQLARQKSELQQSMVQEEARRETFLRAPVDGVVTNIAAARGDSLAADAPVATVIPRGSGLHAQLLLPTRAIGFVKPGQAVVMRYDAFPFQRFGQADGKVLNIGHTVWAAGDRIGALTAREPVYRIEVALARQTVLAGGQELPLRPGMNISADILLERRTVFEWVFEPVLELRSRLM